MKASCLAIILCALFLSAGAARADRIQLPHDPDITLGVGSGGFFGTTYKVDFERIQPVFLRLEMTIFKSPDRRWFDRMNLYCAISPEFARISYKGRLKTITVEDENAHTYVAQEDGLERADLRANANASGGCGIRQSLYDHPRFHLDVFGEFATAFRSVSTVPETLIVSWGGLSIDVARVAIENADIRLDWKMMHGGITLGFPLSRWKGHRGVRLTPFLLAGYMHFDASVSIKVQENFIAQLESLGVDSEIIPDRRGVELDKFTASIGTRFDIGSNHAFEAAGSFFVSPAGTRVYWATLSYSIRFDYPW